MFSSPCYLVLLLQFYTRTLLPASTDLETEVDLQVAQDLLLLNIETAKPSRSTENEFGNSRVNANHEDQIEVNESFSVSLKFELPEGARSNVLTLCKIYLKSHALVKHSLSCNDIFNFGEFVIKEPGEYKLYFAVKSGTK